MAKLKAIQNHIIFQFLDGFSNRDLKQFAETTDWGFEVVDKETSMEAPRWGKVISVGKDADPDIKVGMEILIDKLKWTTAFEFEGEDYWRTDSDQVLMINEGEEPVHKGYQAPDNTKMQEHIRNVWK